MSVAVKVCGVRTFEDALAAAEAGAGLLGLNFYPPSPRYVDPSDARALCGRLRAELGAACPALVGVFVNEAPDRITAVIASTSLDLVQLSGDEPLETLAALHGTAFRALRPRSVNEAAAQAEAIRPYLLADERAPSAIVDAYHPDLYGGTGEAASVEIARAVGQRIPRLMLAGGLTPENVAGRVETVRPWGVDVASGVETPGQPGRKDHTRIRRFTAAVRSAKAERQR
jgi:phosphoribosylanthranilate isomerase